MLMRRPNKSIVMMGGKTVNEKFFELKKDKQDRMINGAMKVFARNGYKRASTDDMVKEAGVSKGLWFHYFGNKLGLYAFVADYAVKYMNMELAAMFNRHPEDYFETTLAVELTKMSVRKSYPYIPLFLSSMEREKDEEALTVLGEYKDSYRKARMKAYEKVRMDNFRDEVSMEILARTLGLTLDGFLREEYEEDAFSEENYKQEAEQYLRMMAALVENSEA